MNNTNRDEISKLISYYYPKIQKDRIETIVANFENFSYDEVKTVLEQGTRTIKKGKRLLLAYLRSAPYVYKHTSNHEFESWLSALSEVSRFSIFCAEDFIDSSPVIIEAGGLKLLNIWTTIGLSIEGKNKKIPISYFKNSGNVLIEIDYTEFKDLVSYGEKLGTMNVNVAESYFQNLSILTELFIQEDLRYFCLIIEKMLQKNWKLAVDMLNNSKKMFSSVPESKTRTVLTSIDILLEHGETPSMALFDNAYRVVSFLDDNSYDRWIGLAFEISEIDTKAAVSFLKESPEILKVIDIEEIEEWMAKGSDKLSGKGMAFQKFVQGSCKRLKENVQRTRKSERAYLIDIGIHLAIINPECVESFFEYSPEVLRILNETRFNKWISIGEEISAESSVYGSGYYRDSLAVFRNRSSSVHEEILKMATILLNKERILVSAFIGNLPKAIDELETSEIKKWAGIGVKIHELDKRLAVDYFSHSPLLLSDLGISELEEWALNGLLISEEKTLLGRPYFSLRSKGSKDFIEKLTGSVDLRKVSGILHYYGLGLAGVSFSIRSRKELSIGKESIDINPLVSGRTIYLAPKMDIYGDFNDNFHIYKLSVMHEIGHVLFSSTKISLKEASGIIKKISDLYTYPEQGNKKTGSDIETNNRNMDIKDIIGMFPHTVLAATMFGILEDARIEYMIMDRYRGIRQELEKIRHKMLVPRPEATGDLEIFVESVLWLSTENEPAFELMEKYKPVLNKVRHLLNTRLLSSDSSILDSLDVTFEIYRILDEISGPLEKKEYRMLKNIEYRGAGIDICEKKRIQNQTISENVISNFIPETGTKVSEEKEKNQDKNEREERVQATYAIEKNWNILGNYRYDEWDFVINDYKSGWCTVNEIEPAGGTTYYYTDAIRRYHNEIALIKHIFSVMKPVDFLKLRQQTDGTEIDIDKVIDSLIEKKCGVNPDDRSYVRWDKQKRDVATLFLVDVSASTSKRLDEGKRTIIDVEKDALVIMIHALESIGDKYAINAFSGHRRNGVEYFVIKSFDEKMSDTVAKRISILEPVSNTRLGPAIRHSIRKLEKVDAKTKMIILLSDGEPYDTCKGEGAYQGSLAEEDTKIAIQEVNAMGMHLFCITVDSNPGEYLDNIFSNIGYTIIDDARKLPETLPVLYKRITT
ncbi:nitric oxide reductase activation protein NorD [Methanolobus bombayensis]|uniref:nitric oxide reductase activation protein NorD n=1 Tax=Methanolobus bombayensis TaxID=38023 RepID=UPI001AEA039C|nr:VWA domain-containing protein [Methanolobus bombayensis]MBP1908512.1 hypothetical protein [Methanolobus bombayensis]